MYRLDCLPYSILKFSNLYSLLIIKKTELTLQNLQKLVWKCCKQAHPYFTEN